MSCFHPLYRLSSEFTKSLPFGRDKNFICGSVEFKNLRKYVPDHLWQRVPCGKCIGCRIDYAKTWADRCFLELNYHEHAEFLTLTYDDDHLPYTYVYDPQLHRVEVQSVLQRRDLTLFIKRLRKRFSDTKLSIFACGEYGDDGGRPHYHLIVFGLRLPDVEIGSSDWRKFQPQPHGYIAFSDILNSLWTYGRACTSEVNYLTCQYCARYMVKKLKGQTLTQVKADYDSFVSSLEDSVPLPVLRPQPFATMSRRPAIGRQFVLDHSEELFKYDSIIIKKDGNAIDRPLPRYFVKMLEEMDLERTESIKLKRQEISKMRMDPRSQTSLKDYEAYMSVLEYELCSQQRRTSSRLS